MSRPAPEVLPAGVPVPRRWALSLPEIQALAELDRRRVEALQSILASRNVEPGTRVDLEPGRPGMIGPGGPALVEVLPSEGLPPPDPER